MSYKILIVDDEPEVVKALKIRLERAGYKTIVAYDGETGLKKAMEEKPDLIILDIILPGIDGYKVCEILKTDPVMRIIPIIMLTAKNMGEDLEKALEKKANWYIAKPYDDKYLLKKVSDLIQERQKHN